jgi:hypothetical protein
MSDEGMIRLLIEGEQACFRRIEFEKAFVSYDVMPPLFADRCLRKVLGHDMEYQLTGIHVLHPVRFAKVTLHTYSGERVGWVVKDVAYVIEAASPTPPTDVESFEPENQPFLGFPSMPAQMRLLHKDEIVTSQITSRHKQDLGWLPYAQVDRDPIVYCRPNMVAGYIDLNRSSKELMVCA